MHRLRRMRVPLSWAQLGIIALAVAGLAFAGLTTYKIVQPQTHHPQSLTSIASAEQGLQAAPLVGGSGSSTLLQRGFDYIKTTSTANPGLGAWAIDVKYDPTQVLITSCAPAPGGTCTIDSDIVHATGAGAKINTITHSMQLATLAFTDATDPTATIDTHLVYTAGSDGIGTIALAGQEQATSSVDFASISFGEISGQRAASSTGHDLYGLISVPIVGDITASTAHHATKIPIQTDFGLAAIFFCSAGVLYMTTMRRQRDGVPISRPMTRQVMQA